MESKGLYNKPQILGKFKPGPPPSQCNSAELEKMGVYSGTTIEPASVKMPGIDSNMLYVQKGKPSSPVKSHHPPNPESEKKAKEEELVPVKEKNAEGKMAVFSFVASYLGIDSMVKTWYFANKKMQPEKMTGP